MGGRTSGALQAEGLLGERCRDLRAEGGRAVVFGGDDEAAMSLFHRNLHRL